MLRIRIVQTGTMEVSPEEGTLDNRPTCSLIEFTSPDGAEKLNMLIDLDHPAKDSADLLAALGALGIIPQEINVVLLTHLHPDHIGHKDLFTNATFIFHQEEKLAFYFKNHRTLKIDGDMIFTPAGGALPLHNGHLPDLSKLGDNIYIRHVPGHTRGSLAIFARIYKFVYAFAGDIFLNKAYYDNWEPPAMSCDREKIFEHMDFIRNNSDVIVPGHGAPFKTR